MNKANVFLLVVVSSLLTYISTATQPLATAGVAQEKWEYFRGDVYQTSHEDSNGNSYTRRIKRYPAGTVDASFFNDLSKHDSYEVDVRLEGGIQSTLSSKSFSNAMERGKYFLDTSKELIALSGQYGWHVFQVTAFEPVDHPTKARGSTMYWRRRVQ